MLNNLNRFKIKKFKLNNLFHSNFSKIMVKEIMFKEIMVKEIMFKEIMIKEIMFKEIMVKEIMFKEIMGKEIMFKDLIVKEIMGNIFNKCVNHNFKVINNNILLIVKCFKCSKKCGIKCNLI